MPATFIMALSAAWPSICTATWRPAPRTGGLTNKKFGRVGDSPIIGAGTYADNATCAVSCTGTGEEFIRHAVAYDISARLAYLKQPLKEAVSHVLRQRLQA